MVQRGMALAFFPLAASAAVVRCLEEKRRLSVGNGVAEEARVLGSSM